MTSAHKVTKFLQNIEAIDVILNEMLTVLDPVFYSSALTAIDRLRKMPDDERRQMGQTAQDLLNRTLSQSLLCGKFCDAVEVSFGLTK